MKTRAGMGCVVAMAVSCAASVALMACKNESGGASKQGSSGPGTAASGAVDVKLPSSTTRGTYREDALLVTIGQGGIRLGETRGTLIPLPPAAEAAQGVSTEYKGGARATFYLPPLGDAIRAQWADGGGENPRASLVVDEGAPYRVLVEVLFTMGRLQINDLCLVVRKEERRACIEYKMPKSDPNGAASLAAQAEKLAALPSASAAPSASAPPKTAASAAPAAPKTSASVAAAPSIAPVLRPEMPTLNGNLVALIVTKDGYSLRTHGASPGAGCDKIAKVEDHYDTAGLRKCLEKVRAAVGEAPITFTLTAPGEAPFQVVVDALDAARETDSGAALMPPVMFAIPL